MPSGMSRTETTMPNSKREHRDGTNLWDYLSKRGITDEQMNEARRRTQEMLEQGVRQTDSEVAMTTLSEHVGRMLNEMREAERVGDKAAVDAGWERLNRLLLLRHKVYAGDEEAIDTALALGGTEADDCSSLAQ